MELEHHAGDDHREARPQRCLQVTVDKSEHGAGHATCYNSQGGADHFELHQAASPVWVRVAHFVVVANNANVSKKKIISNLEFKLFRDKLSNKVLFRIKIFNFSEEHPQGQILFQFCPTPQSVHRFGAFEAKYHSHRQILHQRKPRINVNQATRNEI